jgi:hypothetical protein
MVTINNMDDLFDLARQAMEISYPSVEAEVSDDIEISHVQWKDD